MRAVVDGASFWAVLLMIDSWLFHCGGLLHSSIICWKNANVTSSSTTVAWKSIETMWGNRTVLVFLVI